VLAIGAPDYAALTAAGGGHWPPLPGAAAELRALADALGAQRVTALAGAEASAERLRALSRSGALQSIDVLHVAAHAVAAADAPERSALILGLAPGLAAESARLSAPEVAALRLGARLVVFSACDTASGRWQPGEGILGLPQAIFTAAQATTVLTRWAVPDEGAAVFMRRFYRHLAAGRSAVSALARARAEARAGDAADRDARVWAGFIAYGAW
jgi:CHAT domain-containing protein